MMTQKCASLKYFLGLFLICSCASTLTLGKEGNHTKVSPTKIIPTLSAVFGGANAQTRPAVSPNTGTSPYQPIQDTQSRTHSSIRAADCSPTVTISAAPAGLAHQNPATRSISSFSTSSTSQSGSRSLLPDSASAFPNHDIGELNLVIVEPN